MAPSMASPVFLCILFVLASSPSPSSASVSVCPLDSHLFLNNLQSQCPLSEVPSLSIEVDGETLDRALTSSGRIYTAVLFYASSCPFSRESRDTFDLLSSKFPHIRHLIVEQSDAMPSVFSRYGIRSLPSILMASRTAKLRYHGSKDVDSLVEFYKKTTGFEPIEYISGSQPSTYGITEKPLVELMSASSPKEMITREPYMVFAIVFLSLRAFIYLCPGMLPSLRALWVLYIPRLNRGIFGETSQVLGRVTHMFDVKRIWNKMRLCKTRNFQRGAKNARVWASSLASVSLGESSASARGPVGES